MVEEDPWAVLGIARTTDERRIKKAYAARLKHVHPEDDAEGFQRLREAYEAALALVRWEALHRDAPADAVGPVPPASEPPPWLAAPWAAPVAPTRDALQLADAVTRLAGDPERRASEEAWRELLASEALWNVDTRRAFEEQLIRRLLARELVLAPAAWGPLQLEFHWSAEALSDRVTLPPGVAELLLDRRDEAPVDFGARLCDEGRYDEARALLQEIARGRSKLAGQALRLLARCDAEEAADALMGDVRELRADGRAWSDVAAWRALLERTPLRRAVTRQAFREKLFAFLAEHGQGLGGPAWQLLEDRFRWSREVPAADLARAAGALSPAILEAIEGAFPALSDAEVIERLAPFVEHLEGEAGERARRLFEASGEKAVDRAERLERLERRREAIEEAAPVARLAAGGSAARARELVERVGRAVLEEVERLHARRRFAAAAEQLAPVVAHLPPGLGTEARLLLARCHRAAGSYARAEEPLDEVLAADPWNRSALLLMAEIKEESGQREGAATACVRVLQLDPGNREAARRLERLQAEREAQAQASAPAEAASGSGLPWWPIWLVLWMAVNGRCGAGGVGALIDNVTLAKVLGVAIVLAVVAVLGFVALDVNRRGRTALGLEPDDSDPRARSRGRWALAGALLLAVGLAAAFIWVNRPAPLAPPGSRPGARPRAAVGREARPPAAVGEARAHGRAKNVQIVSLGPEELPLRGGRTVSLSATVRYDLSSGGGVVKLFAIDRPGGRAVEVASRAVSERSGSVVVSGRYRVPSGSTRIDITVPLYSGSRTETETVATAFLAVGP